MLHDNRIHGRSNPVFAEETGLRIPFRAPASCSAYWDDTAWIRHTLATGVEMGKRATTRTILLSHEYECSHNYRSGPVGFAAYRLCALRRRNAL